MLAPVLVAGLLVGAIPQVGDTAPDFTVKDTDGKVYILSELVKQGPVIVAFFPKAFTRGCTKELKAYTARHAEIEQLQGRVLAFSTDDAPTLTRFKADLKAPFPFIPDPEGKVVDAYDVKMPLVTVSKRYTFVVGADRKVLKVDSGGDAVDPTGAITSCSQGKAAAPTAPVATPGKDAAPAKDAAAKPVK
ncbi:redoxin domain-containing protein [Myxococcus sp. K15C18031901]|uniref:peroxiredoxin n=1 Tax=Myxococcus dinghuensis TaxID=2906761 RepID=UPI0020A80F42|nr:redoxin domain-containing protein [Myxococcus dinghuensis]MCP3100154.1 redoxin domain-containing protein [Myxococcus dinghuensis]